MMQQPQERRSNDLLALITEGPLRIVAALFIPVIGFLLLWRSFIFMRDGEASKLAIAVIALLVGVFGIWFLFWATNLLVEQFPQRLRDSLRPYVFVGPAIVILMVYLIYPVFDTMFRSVHDARSVGFVGLDNYEFIFTNGEMLKVLRNNLLWIIVVTSFTVSMGLLIAVLVDRIGRWEPVAKSLIFLPMAISAVGASVIWRFMYTPQLGGDNSPIGLINAIWVDVLGGEPINFWNEIPINNYALMLIMIWLLTGFCMVILSAAVKGVPDELLEAARMDGANEVQIFFRVIIPVISSTLATVTTTVLIMVLKVFDIVYVMTRGRRDTEVVANRMYNEFFVFGHYGRGSALAMLLLIAVLPVIIWNIRNLRKVRN